MHAEKFSTVWLTVRRSSLDEIVMCLTDGLLLLTAIGALKNVSCT